MASSADELIRNQPVCVAIRVPIDWQADPPRIAYYRSIEGESGTGKELVARAVHQLSAGRERRFCDVNCTAFPEELLESDLFGHAKGAFAGAVVDRAGLFEEGGNRARAARALGLSRQGLLKTLARLGVERTSTREG